MESVISSKEQLLITGDLNSHIDIVDNPDTIKFADLLESFCLQQHVTLPTHVHGHTLDLIRSHCSESIIKSSPLACRFISDHASIICNLIPAEPKSKSSPTGK